MADLETTLTPHHLGFDIRGAELKDALAIAFNTPVFGHSRAEAWSVDRDGKRMVLHWAMPTAVEKGVEAFPLPVPLELELIVPLVEGWLSKVDYGPEPDTDGSTGKSSRVYCESWAHIDGHGYTSFVAIEPHWLVYGK